MLYGTKLSYGIVIYVIKQLILKVNQNIISLKHINTKKHMVLLLNNVNSLPQYILIDTNEDCRKKVFILLNIGV